MRGPYTLQEEEGAQVQECDIERSFEKRKINQDSDPEDDEQ